MFCFLFDQVCLTASARLGISDVNHLHLRRLSSFLEHLHGVAFESTTSCVLTLITSSLLGSDSIDWMVHACHATGINRSVTTSVVTTLVLAFVLLGLLVDDAHQTALESLFVLGESILLPGVVEDCSVELMTVHAALEEADACLDVGRLVELERSAVRHELLEFRWVSSAKIFKGGFNFLLFDGGVLFVLTPSWKALPW